VPVTGGQCVYAPYVKKVNQTVRISLITLRTNTVSSLLALISYWILWVNLRWTFWERKMFVKF